MDLKGKFGYETRKHRTETAGRPGDHIGRGITVRIVGDGGAELVVFRAGRSGHGPAVGAGQRIGGDLL